VQRLLSAIHERRRNRVAEDLAGQGPGEGVPAEDKVERRRVGKKPGRKRRPRDACEEMDGELISADIEDLLAMGFTRADAADAVLLAGPGNVDGALEWLLNRRS